jgi:hypothetical protein
MRSELLPSPRLYHERVSSEIQIEAVLSLSHHMDDRLQDVSPKCIVRRQSC